MAAQIDEVQTFDADPETVFAMLSDEKYIEYKCEQSGSLEVTAEVSEDGDEVRIHNRRVLPAQVPGFVKKFLGDTIPLDETQVWGPVAADGSRTGTFTVDFDGQPLQFSGTIELRPHGDGTVVETKGTLKCTVRIVGGKIEGFAKGWIGKYLNKEERVGNQWLSDHS